MGLCALGLGLSSSSGLMSHVGLVMATRPSQVQLLDSVLQFADGQQDFWVAHPQRKTLAYDFLAVQWLRCCTPKWGHGFDPGGGTNPAGHTA